MNENTMLTPEEIYAAERLFNESTGLQEEFADLNSFLHHFAQLSTSEAENDMPEV